MHRETSLRYRNSIVLSQTNICYPATSTFLFVSFPPSAVEVSLRFAHFPTTFQFCYLSLSCTNICCPATSTFLFLSFPPIAVELSFKICTFHPVKGVLDSITLDCDVTDDKQAFRFISTQRLHKKKIKIF